MFTGLIQQVGRLVRLEETPANVRLTVGHDEWTPPLAPGESVAVQGVCLTVADCGARQFVCDVLKETLARTSLRTTETGAGLNLERAVQAGDRLGGHLVSGHVDGVGHVTRISRRDQDRVVEVACSDDLMQGIVPKGSVACDGISLTVAALRASSFEVHIIPFTWEHTAWRSLRPGGAINVETDVVGKYVRRFMEPWRTPGALSMDDLRDAGFLE